MGLVPGRKVPVKGGKEKKKVVVGIIVANRICTCTCTIQEDTLCAAAAGFPFFYQRAKHIYNIGGTTVSIGPLRNIYTYTDIYI